MRRRAPAALALVAIGLMASPAIAADAFYVGTAFGSSLAATTSIAHDRSVSSIGSTSNVFAGYGMQFNRLYLGVEGSLSFPQNDLRYARPGADFAESRRNEEGSLSVQPRIGFVIVPELMIFGSVGYATSNLRPREGGITTYDQINGLRVGVGIDAQVSERVFVRGEYTHTLFNRDSTDPSRPELNRGSATLGLGYRF